MSLKWLVLLDLRGASKQKKAFMNFSREKLSLIAMKLAI